MNMKNKELRESLIGQADEAFVELNIQISNLLDLAEVYFTNAIEISASQEYKHTMLIYAVANLGSLPFKLAEILLHWHKGELPALSSIDIELQILNEIYLNMSSVLRFLILHKIENRNYDMFATNFSFVNLIRINKLMS